MCIAILNIDTTPIAESALYNSWIYNDDGAGLMWAHNGKLFTQKFPNDFTQESFDAFYKRYLEVRSLTDLPIGLHFRIATHGMSTEYLHPFNISDNVAIMHNGIISGFGTREVSDTAEFAQVLSMLPPYMTDSVAGLTSNFAVEILITNALGFGNKVIALDNEGEYFIFNEAEGHWYGTNWYSNDSYKAAKRYYGSTAMTPHTATASGVKYYGYSDDFYDEVWNKDYASTAYTNSTVGKKKESDWAEGVDEIDSFYSYQACLTCNENGYVDMYGDCAKCANLTLSLDEIEEQEWNDSFKK
jgi:predicted glutamine amidotransferase